VDGTGDEVGRLLMAIIDRHRLLVFRALVCILLAGRARRLFVGRTRKVLEGDGQGLLRCGADKRLLSGRSGRRVLGNCTDGRFLRGNGDGRLLPVGFHRGRTGRVRKLF
jgi:hypothetical protein